MAFSNDYSPQYYYHRYPKQSYLLILDEYTKKKLLRFVPKKVNLIAIFAINLVGGRPRRVMCWRLIPLALVENRSLALVPPTLTASPPWPPTPVHVKENVWFPKEDQPKDKEKQKIRRHSSSGSDQKDKQR